MAFNPLDLPSFLLTVFVMYWSLPLLSLFGVLEPFNLKGTRNDPYGWGIGMSRYFKVKVLKINANKVYDGEAPVMFLCNHRSWADFFMDVYMTNGRGMMLSRMAVLYVFPAFMLAVRSIRGVILFKRGSIADKEAFNAWIDSEILQSPQKGLIVYPEGHRSTLGASLPLKRGMLHYAHSRKMPVQIVITRNKELMLSEKAARARFGATLAVAHSEVLQPAAFPDFEAFMAAVQGTWDATWALAASTDLAGLPEFKPQRTETNPPLSSRLQFLAHTLVVCAALVAVLAGCAWLALRLLQQLAPRLQYVVVASTVLYLVAGYFHCQLPAGYHMVPATTNGAAKKAQ